MMDWAKFIREQGEMQQRSLAMGIKIGEERLNDSIRALDRAYQKAVLDPKTVMPSYLMAAIYTLISNIGDSRTVEAIERSLPNLATFTQMVEDAQKALKS